MSNNLEKILDDITELKKEISEELEKKKRDFKYKIERGKVTFEADVLEKQRIFKQNLILYLVNAKFSSYIVSPFIYMQIIPFFMLDIFVSIYQWTNFPIYKISKVRRKDYIIFDRHKLGYLNTLEKFNCLYCSYVNGLIAYVREVASRTEQFFCPIRHAKKQQGSHDRYHLFTDYGDTESYKGKLKGIREALKKIE